eukprot:1997660-Rhodomonas_salina.1
MCQLLLHSHILSNRASSTLTSSPTVTSNPYLSVGTRGHPLGRGVTCIGSCPRRRPLVGTLKSNALARAQVRVGVLRTTQLATGTTPRHRCKLDG